MSADIARARAAYHARRIAESLGGDPIDLDAIYSEARALVELLERLRAEEAHDG